VQHSVSPPASSRVSSISPTPPSSTSLVTLALLKANFDAGRDHIQMFEPFLLDTAAHLPSEDFTAEVIQQALKERHGLNVPHGTLTTLLARGVKRRFFERKFGRYFKLESARPTPDIAALRNRIIREHIQLASSFKNYALTRKVTLPDDDRALALILGFIAEYQIPLLLDPSNVPTAIDVPALSSVDARLVAHFITSVCLRDPNLSEYLQRVVEGFVLQNALLLKDISNASRKFDNLQVFLDGGCVLDLLGLTGQANATAARDGLDLLRSANARVGVFDKTLTEVKNILAVYENCLKTPQGRQQLRASALTTHLLVNKYAPSDVRSAIALVDVNMEALGVGIRFVPMHDRRYTLDEAALAEALRGGTEHAADHPRIVHDVDCVAAILTLRAGHAPDSLDHAKAVFVTTNRLVAKTVDVWYRASGGVGVSPMLHHLTLSNLAWLKRPMSAVQLKLHELVALCAAAVRPTRAMWSAFLKHLRDLEQQGSATSEESVAIMSSHLTYRALEDLDNDDDVDATTTEEIVERVKATYSAEADAKVARIQAAAQAAMAGSEARAEEARAAAGSEAERRRQSLMRIDGRIRSVARGIATATFGIAAIILLAALVLSLPGALERIHPGLRWVAYGLVVAGGIFSYAAAISGIFLRQQRDNLEWAIRRKLRHWMIGEEEGMSRAALDSDVL